MGNLPKVEVTQQIQQKFDFEKIASSQAFSQLIKAKKRFLVPITFLFLSLYFLLPVLTSYTTILNKPAIGSISWTWVYSIGLFIMTWTLCMVYVKKAAQFDHMAENIVKNYQDQGDQSL